MNVYEYAVKNKLRFASPKGELSVEQLWDVPLRSRDTFNLDTIAKGLNRTVKTYEEESFVDQVSTGQRKELVKLEIVKDVIRQKLESEETSRKRQENAQKREELLEILAQKQRAGLQQLSEDDLKKQIAALE